MLNCFFLLCARALEVKFVPTQVDPEPVSKTSRMYMCFWTEPATNCLLKKLLVDVFQLN